MKKTVFFLIILTMLSKFMGLFREMTLSYFYGASSVSDAYLVSQVIPSVIFSFIGVGISTGYIPMYAKVEERLGIQGGNRYTNNLINIMLVLSGISIALGLLLTKQIVKVFASGFEGQTLELAIVFTRISMIGLVFQVLVYLFVAFLQIKGNYLIPAILGFPLNLLQMLSIALSSKGNILILVIGSLIALGSEVIILLPFAYKKGYRYKKIIDIKDKDVQNLMYLALPVIISTAVNDINILVDKTMASNISEGGISALNYANMFLYSIVGIIATSISTTLYPLISRMAVKNNIDGLKKSVSDAIGGIVLLGLPCTIGGMIFAEPLVKFLFNRGRFDSQAIMLTSQALFFYMIGIVGIGLREVLSRTFYSLQDTKTPTINAAIGLALNVVLNLVLSTYLGIGGLALGTSISATITLGLLFISLRKKIGPFGMKQITITFLKVLLASLLMGLIAKVFFNYLTKSIGHNISLLLAIAVGAISYLIAIYFMKIQGVDMIVNAFKKKMKI